jgi:tetratricopeptide (TPR) repeat protein
MVEFITTLRYDRNHRGALRSLRASESQYRTIVYAVREGDTFKSIAGQIYRNIDYDYIVKFFSNLSSEKELVPGLVLTLPNIEIDFTLRFFNYSKEITLARKYYRDKEFRKLLPCAENILNHVPDSDEAVFLINMAYYGISDQYLNGEDYKAAIETLKKVDPKFKNVKRRIAYIESLHTKRISDAEKKNNTENYQKGKLLYSRGQYVKALSVLEKVTPGFLNVQKVISDLKSQMKKESEIHYRKGVKHYLKEELSEAIDEWRVASQLDPENAKIKNDIDNAGQLLKKINKIK